MAGYVGVNTIIMEGINEEEDNQFLVDMILSRNRSRFKE